MANKEINFYQDFMNKYLMVVFIFLTTVSFSNEKKTRIEDKLSEKDKQNSIFFKMSRNSNRVWVFEQLQSHIRINSVKTNFNANQQTSYSFYTTSEDVISLLGEPNVQVNNSFVYTLNPQTGCKAVIEFDNNKTVVYFGIKDCS